jgi:hypothetical protein
MVEHLKELDDANSPKHEAARSPLLRRQQLRQLLKIAKVFA